MNSTVQSTPRTDAALAVAKGGPHWPDSTDLLITTCVDLERENARLRSALKAAIINAEPRTIDGAKPADLAYRLRAVVSCARTALVVQS